METVCPICNGLEKVRTICPLCGDELLDGGKIENFWGPYAPYMEELLYGEEQYCTHLLFCPHCHYDTRMRWELCII